MRALVLREFAGPDALQLDDVPAPAGEEALIEVHAAGVSYADLLVTRGAYQARPSLPFVPGLEVAGILRSAPPECPFQPGDRVAAFMFGGAFAEEARADPAHVVGIPRRLGFPEAAGLVVNYHTAWFVLRRRAGVEPGDRVLVHGAGGGLGSSVVAVAKALGAFVVAVARRGPKADVASAAGADAVVDPDDAGWPAAARHALGGRGADVAVDPVGGDRFDDTIRSLAPGGRLVVVGFTGGAIPQVKVNRLLLRNVAVVGAAWREYLDTEPGFIAEAAGALNRLFEEGHLAPPTVGGRYGLDRGADALRALADRRAAGKQVIVVRPASEPGAAAVESPGREVAS